MGEGTGMGWILGWRSVLGCTRAFFFCGGRGVFSLSFNFELLLSSLTFVFGDRDKSCEAWGGSGTVEVPACPSRFSWYNSLRSHPLITSSHRTLSTRTSCVPFIFLSHVMSCLPLLLPFPCTQGPYARAREKMHRGAGLLGGGSRRGAEMGMQWTTVLVVDVRLCSVIGLLFFVVCLSPFLVRQWGDAADEKAAASRPVISAASSSSRSSIACTGAARERRQQQHRCGGGGAGGRVGGGGFLLGTWLDLGLWALGS